MLTSFSPCFIRSCGGLLSKNIQKYVAHNLCIEKINFRRDSLNLFLPLFKTLNLRSV